MTDNALELAHDLIARGIPVIVCRPNTKWTPGSSDADVKPVLTGWTTVTAAECDLTKFRPGKDALALVGGQGIDLVDVDAKIGVTLDDLPTFTTYGRTLTPSGGWHLWVPSTGFNQLSPLIVAGKAVGDYVGGNAQGGSRRLGYLPGSTRPKYPDGAYTIDQPLDLDALLDSNPDDELVAMLLSAGGRKDGNPGDKATTSKELRKFLELYENQHIKLCSDGRAAITHMHQTADVAAHAQGGRHGWAVTSACRLVELMRSGCADRGDYDNLVATLDRIKPEGGTNLDDVMRWAIANVKNGATCSTHGLWADALDALDASPGRAGGEKLAETVGEVPPERILDAVHRFACQYVAFPSPAAAVAFVAWVAHTHLLEHFDSTPRLAIVAPEKQSGKTRCLEVAESLIPRPMRSSNCSTAVLFRLIASDERPTVLLDEADAIWAERGANEDLRSLLNAGHRRGSNAHRMVGEGASMTAKTFPTFAAVALAGIGDLPETLMDRSVVIRMKRRAPNELVQRWKFGTSVPVGNILRRWLAEWLDTVEDVQPPDDLEDVADRVADVWEPLFIVGDLAGGKWPALIRDACRSLTSDQPVEMSLRQRLLSDLRDVWPASMSFTATTLLLSELANIPDGPWGADGPYGYTGLTSRKLGYLLGQYGVKPTHDATKTARGYRRADLDDAWSRYLPPLGDASKASKASGQTVMEVVA